VWPREEGALEEDDKEGEAGSSLEPSPLLLDTLTQDDADDLAECGHDIGGACDDLVDIKRSALGPAGEEI
jgi:hypothetical protein